MKQMTISFYDDTFLSNIKKIASMLPGVAKIKVSEIDENNIPNKKTVAAIKAMNRGEVFRCDTIEEFDKILQSV